MSALAVALACTFVAAAVNWCTRVRPSALLETISKPLTTILVIWVAIAAGGPTTPTVLAVIGLTFCLAGDIALMDVFDNFVAGLAAFLVGHLVFMVMFSTQHLDRPWWGVPAAAVLAAHGWWFGRRIVAGARAKDPKLHGPVVAYLFVIMVMAVVAAMTGNAWAVAGAAAFVLSDTVLGWRAFVRETKYMALAVMVTYHAALVGIALSLR